MLGLLAALGTTTILLVICIISFIPAILTLIVGAGFAKYFKFTGITWWAFMIIFYIVIASLLGFICI